MIASRSDAPWLVYWPFRPLAAQSGQIHPFLQCQHLSIYLSVYIYIYFFFKKNVVCVYIYIYMYSYSMKHRACYAIRRIKYSLLVCTPRPTQCIQSKTLGEDPEAAVQEDVKEGSFLEAHDRSHCVSPFLCFGAFPNRRRREARGACEPASYALGVRGPLQACS